MAETANPTGLSIAQMDDEQLPVPQHRLHGWPHFAGLYAAEHVAATEFVIGATFVALGAGIWDILIGLMIGNILAILTFTFITSPIAVESRMSLFTYIQRIAGDKMTMLFNCASVLIFATISAAMITVSATAVRVLFNIPPQLEAYPTSLMFVGVVVAVGVIVILVAMFGFNALTEFSAVCAPWLLVMFISGGLVLMPALVESVTGYTTLGSFSEFIQIAGTSVWTGINSEGQPGIGLLEVTGFAWAANTFAHIALVDMALLRYAKKARYGLATGAGMMFGHYIAWISAGLMGAATAAILQTSIVKLDPGDVAYYALGASGFVIVIVAGWTTANSNLYRAGLAAQGLFPNKSRKLVTMAVGVVVVALACFPFVFRSMLPLLTYAGLLLTPVGGIVFAEHQIFPRIGLTRFWARYKQLPANTPAIVTWGASLAFAAVLNISQIMPFYYLFLPTWFFSMAVYTIMAKKAGAAEKFPEAEEADRQFNAEIDAHHEKLAETEHFEHVTDTRMLTKVIRAVYIVFGLLLPLVLAIITMFASPDVYAYLVNRENFYSIAIWCTLLYFVLAYWDLQRSKALQGQVTSESSEDMTPATAT